MKAWSTGRWSITELIKHLDQISVWSFAPCLISANAPICPRWTSSYPVSSGTVFFHHLHRAGLIVTCRHPSGTSSSSSFFFLWYRIGFVFDSVVVGAFQIIFRAKIHVNDVFSFLKNYFWYQHIKTIQNIQTILNFSKKKNFKFFRNAITATALNHFINYDTTNIIIQK